MSEAAVAQDRGTVLGYVEARTADRVLGWAWDTAAPEARLAIVLLDGAAVVAEAVADQPREDLARNGIGDGAHAFAFLLPEALRGRAAALAVAVRGADGRLVPLAAPAAAAAALPADQASLTRLARGVEQLAAGQRTVLRALRAPAQPEPERDDRLAEIGTTQERIERSIAALEVFVARLDERLAALAERQAPPRVSPLALALAALLGVLAALALVVALGFAF